MGSEQHLATRRLPGFGALCIHRPDLLGIRRTVGIYSGWSTLSEVRTDGRWDVEALGRAMEDAFPEVAPSVNPFIEAVRSS